MHTYGRVRSSAMSEIHIPTACLDDARRVLAAQDPDIAALADHWSIKVWRAAVKAAAVEMDAQGEEGGHRDRAL